MSKASTRYQTQEKGKISSYQLALLGITFVISTGDIMLPSFVAQEAQKDSWFAVILGTLFSLVTVSIFITLGLRHPEKTIVQYTSDLLGKPLGKLVGGLYILYFLVIAWVATRQLGELFMVSFNPEAPMIIYNFIFILVAAYAAAKGIETIARVNQILIPFGLSIIAVIVLVNVPNMDFKNFLPIFYEGINPSIRGGILIHTWIVEMVVLLQILPFTTDKSKTRLHVLSSVIILGISLEFGVLILAIFGPLTAKLIFPALHFTRLANIGEYFQNLDVAIIGLWISGIFVKVTGFFYCGALGIAQLFGLKTYKSMLLPLGILIICFSFSTAKNIVELAYFLHYILPFVCFIFAFVFPSLLLTVSLIRGKKSKKKAH